MNLRTRARLTGSWMLGLIGLWIGLSGAMPQSELPTVPVWVYMLGSSVATGLVVWGSTKTRVDRLEVDMKDRVTKELYESQQDDILRRLESIDTKLERRGNSR
jgi:hypothetical protein